MQFGLNPVQAEPTVGSHDCQILVAFLKGHMDCPARDMCCMSESWINILLGVQARVKHFQTRFNGDFGGFGRDPHAVTVKGSPEYVE